MSTPWKSLATARYLTVWHGAVPPCHNKVPYRGITLLLGLDTKSSCITTLNWTEASCAQQALGNQARKTDGPVPVQCFASRDWQYQRWQQYSVP